MATVWVKVGNCLHQTVQGSQTILETPENKVYNICQNPDTQEIYLEELSDGFKLPEKVYGLETDFMDYVEETFKHTSTNLGILLDGKKGTGKTVTAEILAMRFQRPIILVPTPFRGLQDFISKFSCECVFFFDEFEKTFGNNRRDDDGATSMLLSVMDGTYNTIKRQVFLLTTNNTYIDDNFLGRPSRIRYHKTFGNLSTETVNEIIEDLLIDKSRTNDVKDLVDSLSLSTIDTLKAIITDFNIHPKAPIKMIRDYLNLEFATHRYTITAKRLDEDDPRYDKYTLDDFNKDLALLGTIFIDEDGEEREYEQGDLHIYKNQHVSSSRSVNYIAVGDEFWNCRVIKPMNSHNCMLLEGSGYGNHKWFIRIENPENKPSLYGSIDW